MSSTALSSADSLGQARANLALYTGRQTSLQSFKSTTLSDADVTTFVGEKAHWYPAHHHYGEKVYKESSIFWRISTYFPFFISFSTYTKLGKEAATLDMKKFKVFLAADIARELQFIDTRIQNARSMIAQFSSN